MVLLGYGSEEQFATGIPPCRHTSLQQKPFLADTPRGATNMTTMQIVFEGTIFPTSDNGVAHEHEALTELNACAKKERKLFRRIQKAGNGVMRRIMAHGYLSSFASRFVAMVEQAKVAELRLPLSTYKVLAGSFSLFHPILEVTEFWDVPRSSGNGYRRLHDFGPMNRAAQHMAMRVMSAIFKPRPYQFSVGGKGQAKAVQFVKQKIGEGYVHVQKLDVRDFFGSFLRDGLYKLLPLPKSVIDNLVMPDNLQLKSKKGAKKTNHTSTGAVTNTTSPCASLPVLPQGSLHAPILAEYVVSLVSIDVATDMVIVIYVDDIIVMSKDKVGLETATHALSSGYGASPAGKFEFKVSEETLPSGVVFLGYFLRQLPGGSLTTEPSQANRDEFKGRHKALKAAITKASKKGSKPVLEAAIAEYYVYMRSWVAGFQAADRYGEMAVEAQHRMVSACQTNGVSPAAVKQLAKAHFSHKTTKAKTKGGCKWQVKITEIDLAFASMSQTSAVLP